ncbi:MAG: oleate hydratase, partial [Proteobacteria bacterium]|nr:oleate hydratase [Pseudomonadota bacterium]
QPSFFESNFWYMFNSIFGFQPWHSAMEMRRYVRNFFHNLDQISELHESGWNTAYNNYETIVMPTVKWLRTHGVNFDMGCKVTDVDFKPTVDEKTVQKIHYIQNGEEKDITVNDGDFVFINLGSEVADSREGTMHSVAEIERNKVDGAWTLWEKMAEKQPGLGNPVNFTNTIDHSKFQVFSITAKGDLLKDLILEFTKNKRLGEQHEVIFTGSPWQMILHIPWQPFVKNQDKDTYIILGLSLKHDKGDYIKKAMEDCTGEEILTEMCYQFGFMKDLPEIIQSSDVNSYMLPYVTSKFLPRTMFDRPPVVPENSTNVAFLGQHTEIPEECVFLVNYSTLSSEIAVYTLLNVDKKVTPVYRGTRNLWNWIKAIYWI